ncbi:unnamed protein product [Moneuplotes crassus]|uniref:GP-PDE domain-containing protein n=1 Tax=Euplotes crassus TaxID=5936 RepID=A0AAD1UR25_EUPCR|nr:unnamed protein product [Moneuplotes crassus]
MRKRVTCKNILEMDIQFTKDKKIVVHHDDTLERLTGQKEKVEQLNYDQIHKCKEVVEYPNKDGFYHQKPGIDDGTIPVLEEVFKELPGCIMNIELKVDSREMLYKLLDLIVEYKREHITYIGTNIEELNNIAYELTEDTGIRTFAGTWYIIRTALLYFLGLLPFFDFKYYSVWFPFYEIGAATLMSAEHHHTWYFQLVEVLVSIILVPMRPMFWHLRRRGIQIILFVINYGELADRALKYPMDGFITEIPQGMQDYLSK